MKLHIMMLNEPTARILAQSPSLFFLSYAVPYTAVRRFASRILSLNVRLHVCFGLWTLCCILGFFTLCQ